MRKGKKTKQTRSGKVFSEDTVMPMLQSITVTRLRCNLLLEGLQVIHCPSF